MISTLILGGLMGLLGQGVRAVVGLKSMADAARAANLNPGDLFSAARLVTSLLLGFLIGMAAALATDLSTVVDWRTLLSIAAVGYAGTDILEGILRLSVSPRTGSTPDSATTLWSKVFRADTAPFRVLSPRQAVYDAIRETFPGVQFDDNTALAKLGFDKPALAGLATLIKRRGVNVPTGAVQNCTTVGDVVLVAEGV